MSVRARRRCFLLLGLLAIGLLLGRQSLPRWRKAWEQQRAASFDTDAIRLTAYPVLRDTWLVFDIPRHADGLRVLTNAAVRQRVPPATTREQPREGWRYAVEYALLDRSGQTVAEKRYHLRASVVDSHDTASETAQGISWFRHSDWNPTMTRTIQLPLQTGSAVRLRLRLAACEPDVQEVVARVLVRRERPDFDQPYAWSRLTERTRKRLSRASVYPPALLNSVERCNLLRWSWSTLPPIGLEGRDYDLRTLYLPEITLEEASDGRAKTDGLLCHADQHYTLPLPPGPAQVTLECVRAVSHRDDRTAEVWVRWYPDNPAPEEVRHCLLDDVPQTIQCRANGGLLEIHASSPIFCRVTWSASPDTTDDQEIELQVPQRAIGCYLAEPNSPLDYAVSHVDRLPTPFRLELRRLLPDLSRDPFAPVPQQIEPAIVDYSLLDAQGRLLREGQLTTLPEISPYDQASPNTDMGNCRVTEPARFYFAMPADVSRVRIQAADDTVTVAAFTRPHGLARIQRLPEEQQVYSRLETEERTWFLLQPNEADMRLARNQTVTVFSRVRPPKRDELILSGLFLWEDFDPAGFWKGRFLLTPRESAAPLRAESISSTYGELAPNRDHEVKLIAEPGTDWVEPRLIYSTPTPSPQTVQVWLDRDLWHTFRTRASRGEVNLPKIPSPKGPARHTLRIETEGESRFLVRNLLASQPTLYTKQLARQMDEGRLQFTVFKRTPGPERLILRPFFPEGWHDRVRLRVSIRDLPTRTGGPFEHWTLSLRQIEVLPQTDQVSLILQQDIQLADGGRRCVLSLGSDLPPGRYRVDVQLVDNVPSITYAMLYRLVPGQAPRRQVNVTEAVFQPDTWSVPVGASSISVSQPDLEESRKP